MAEVTCSKCGKTCKSLQGWKMHMSGAHGGYDDSDLAEAAGVAGGEGNVRARMESFAETMPGAGDESSPTTQRRVDGEAGASSAPAPITEGVRGRGTPKKKPQKLGGSSPHNLNESRN